MLRIYDGKKYLKTNGLAFQYYDSQTASKDDFSFLMLILHNRESEEKTSNLHFLFHVEEDTMFLLSPAEKISIYILAFKTD